jgi:hypothetical protein
MTIDSKPCAIQESEKAPEVKALVQPNSVNIGLKKIPNESYTPYIVIIITKAAATMT